jgi:fatty-acid peroxygenase
MPGVIDRPSQMHLGMPRIDGWDSSLQMLADPYRFIGRQCKVLGSDLFETRLLLQPTICMTGEQMAKLFYDPARFRREGAAPEALQATLFGKGVVQGLDDEVHRNRKALFLMLRSPARLADLEGQVRRAWEQAIPAWSSAGPVVLYRIMQPVLTRAVCSWAGVPLPEADLMRRCRQLTLLFDGAASGMREHLQARRARWQAERWLAALVEQSREGRARLLPGSIAQAFIAHRDAAGQLMPARIVAAELLNVLRPAVAVSVYIVCVAHALQANPAWRERLADSLTLGNSAHSGEALGFVQEVRRHYPFFPAVVARVREAFAWNGLQFAKGRRALLDLYGTNHDPRCWQEPHSFRPERWLEGTPGPFEFIPQGGGEAAVHHRCPGEDVALRLMMLAALMLLRRMRYDVPAQDLSLAMNRLPAIPRDGFVIDRVRAA